MYKNNKIKEGRVTTSLCFSKRIHYVSDVMTAQSTDLILYTPTGMLAYHAVPLKHT